MTARDWRSAALCAREADLDLHFREDEASVAKAKALCARCPSRNPCAVAGRDEPWGVWAGLEVGERLGSMLLATPEPPPHQHGTRGRYVENCRCDACTDANRRYIAEWRERPHDQVPEAVSAFEQLALL